MATQEMVSMIGFSRKRATQHSCANSKCRKRGRPPYLDKQLLRWAQHKTWQAVPEALLRTYKRCKKRGRRVEQIWAPRSSPTIGIQRELRFNRQEVVVMSSPMHPSTTSRGRTSCKLQYLNFTRFHELFRSFSLTFS